ncbi:hypothetical protein PAXINDRAFT_8169 [Paxillus involutus ATCC 200175]|nr:hypothetical protein PAXINDRAFT_8169 [Paxillus involutus ATCC 200175]
MPKESRLHSLHAHFQTFTPPAAAAAAAATGLPCNAHTNPYVVACQPHDPFQVEMEHNWYKTTVTASLPHRIVRGVDWASDSPMPSPVATEEETELPLSYGREAIKESVASPTGWHTLLLSWDQSVQDSNKASMGDLLWRTTNTTWGNNVFAHENWDGRNAWMHNKRPEGSVEAPTDMTLTPSVTFTYPYVPNPADTEENSMAEAQSHIDATITYCCRMYLWNMASPQPDGDMEAGIVIHELAHGLSPRLTGRPKNSGCQGWGESGGMGEGWGNFIATSVRSTSTYCDYAMGTWASNREGGIRNYIYSLNTTVNPSTYKTLDKPGYWALDRYIQLLRDPTPNTDGSPPTNDFYRTQTFNPLTGQANPLIPKHGNTLLM